MGLLIKYDSEHSQKRSEALLWWKKLSRSKRLEAIEIWKDELAINSLSKDWSYVMITNSDSTIQRIHEYFNEIL